LPTQSIYTATVETTMNVGTANEEETVTDETAGMDVVDVTEVVSAAADAATTEGLIAHYDMSTADGKLIDITNHGLDAQYVGFTAEDLLDEEGNTVLSFTGNASKYVKLPKGLIDDETFTIEAKISTSTRANHWLYTLGTIENIWPNVKNYFFVN